MAMVFDDDEPIRFRTLVWLNLGAGDPVRVLSRTLTRHSVFLEYTGQVAKESVEMVFPESETHEEVNHLTGRVTRRCRDGIWVCFNTRADSGVEGRKQHASRLESQRRGALHPESARRRSRVGLRGARKIRSIVRHSGARAVGRRIGMPPPGDPMQQRPEPNAEQKTGSPDAHEGAARRHAGGH
jgi:hypothetical protein